MSEENEDGLRSKIQGTVMVCPNCVMDEGDEEISDGTQNDGRQHLILMTIKQDIRTKGASDRFLMICPNCGEGIRFIVTIHKETSFTADLSSLEGIE